MRLKSLFSHRGASKNIFFFIGKSEGESIASHERVFLSVINKLIAIELGDGLKQARDGVTVSINAEDFPILILNWLVVAIVTAS